MKCPRQWAEKYLHGNVGAPSSSLIIGSAVHKANEIAFKGEVVFPAKVWEQIIEESGGYGAINWGRDTPEKAYDLFQEMSLAYWDTVGKFLTPVALEREIEFKIEGIDLPIIGFIDLELEHKIVDYKTTAWYNSKQVQPNQEWRVQTSIYQLARRKPAEVHVITRSKTDPVVIPDSDKHKLYFGLVDEDQLHNTLQYEYQRMLYHMERYGMDYDWPGNVLHEYAYKYCPLMADGRCCRL